MRPQIWAFVPIAETLERRFLSITAAARLPVQQPKSRSAFAARSLFSTRLYLLWYLLYFKHKIVKTWAKPLSQNCFRETDTIYTGLPLYHSSVQWFALGSSVHGGCTVVLRKNFSASKFWPDAVKYKVTVGQYIGEIARFLLGKF